MASCSTDTRVLQIEEQIIVDEARIPYLEAIIARKEPASPLPKLRAVEAAEWRNADCRHRHRGGAELGEGGQLYTGQGRLTS